MSHKPTILLIGVAGKKNSGDQELYEEFIRIVDKHDIEIQLFQDCHVFVEVYKEKSSVVKFNYLFCLVEEDLFGKHSEVLEILGKHLSTETPIILIEGKPNTQYAIELYGLRPFTQQEKESYLYFRDYGLKLKTYFFEVLGQWQAPVHFFDCYSREDQWLLIEQLLTIYRQENECGSSVTVDRNTQALFTAFRFRLLPPELRADYFDKVIVKINDEQSKITVQSSGEYDKEIARIRSFSPEEKQALLDKMRIAEGSVKKADGWHVERLSKGEDIMGIAIDPVSMKMVLTNGHTGHMQAGTILAARISREDDSVDCNVDIDEMLWRILIGLVYLKIDSISSPLVIFYGITEGPENEIIHKETLVKIIRFFKTEMRYILINAVTGGLMEDEIGLTIASFSGEYAFLADSYPANVRFKGIMYPSLQDAYQAAALNDPEWSKSARIGIMVQLVDEKFSYRNPVLVEKLIATDSAELIDNNDKGDILFGICKGEGENYRGKILMVTRGELIKKSRRLI